MPRRHKQYWQTTLSILKRSTEELEGDQSVPHRAVHVGNSSSAASEHLSGGKHVMLKALRYVVEQQLTAWTVEPPEVTEDEHLSQGC